MTTRTMPAAYPFTAVLVVAGLAAYCWYLEPEEAVIWAGVAIMLPTAWAALSMLRRGKKPSNEIRRAILFASLVLIFSLGFAAASSLELLDTDGRTWANRSYGILMGGVLIFMGNYIPKQLQPLDETKYDPVKVQMLQRFAGWAFVSAGIGYALAWMVLPATPANVVASGLVLLATVLIMGRRAFTRLSV